MKTRFISVTLAVLLSSLGVVALWYLMPEQMSALLPLGKVAPDSVEQAPAPAPASGEQETPPTAAEPAKDDAVEPTELTGEGMSQEGSCDPDPSANEPAAADGAEGGAEQAPDSSVSADSTLNDSADPNTTSEPTESNTKLPDLTGKQGAAALAETIAKTVGAGNLSPEEQDQLMQNAQDQKLLSPEEAEKLKTWKQENKLVKMESVGTYQKDGKNITRYRLVGDQGKDLLIDLEEPQDKAGAWKVVGVADAAPADEKSALNQADSLQIVEGFINALRQGEMMKARSYTTGDQVSDVTIAGLCMVFAEGGYQLRAQNPFRASFENEHSSAYLVYLSAHASTPPANVGIELKKNQPEEGWQVAAVSLDSLLSSYEKSADEEGGRYFPLVKNPQGGDSIALFFAFDDFTLTPRSLSQLKIVAELLQADERKLDIAGHTDDVGGEAYNKKLSIKRAEAVKRALINFGVASEKISTAGMGKSQPRRSYSLDDSDQVIEHQRAENRRAEIYLDFK